MHKNDSPNRRFPSDLGLLDRLDWRWRSRIDPTGAKREKRSKRSVRRHVMWSIGVDTCGVEFRRFELLAY